VENEFSEEIPAEPVLKRVLQKEFNDSQTIMEIQYTK